MNRYANGTIYKLVNDVDKEIYIGSTCLPLSKCIYSHKKHAKKENSKLYKHLNTVGWDAVKIILIESFPCENKMELTKRERYYIDQLSPSLNSKKHTEPEQMTKKQQCQKKFLIRDYNCDLCKSTCKLHQKQRHFKTKKHQQMVAEQQKQNAVEIKE